MSYKHVLEESENIYDQLSILTQLVDKYNDEDYILIRMSIVHSNYIELRVTDLRRGLTNSSKYPYHNKGAKDAWKGLEYYHNQIINNL
ncbi:hypothetical protein [Myroides odoratimimus]|uniref:hypothetical protein n=1 Tax=Myroides odoratimimus TaxID=76832 RepID=UPI002577A115|nr:hypothetical protein [Myroides odoratimimus]MDM1529023.1 hypothetical protein [Myroides odoratimimus]MDM1536383.1 hypothetical protein [Myroides odoratimimus]MDM1676047.1 hypothetical protein [Myroides odoratimimus]